ncbi:ABC transporter substrate-binding protein [Candidatus Competibacter phosphatis]|uniref:ABC transporter substrate-binding protein n=1 Tax=Candidatus Competibacter phosphatis TaxID=221280 RepID=A0ABX1TI80_9GAMM|nr:ABC transporter substrate-binding protein [Candidatus Competibacter phosphatis]NMQ18274.1 ABC transporter substrate-binding protein [Candidatus Competibacter phosphatis]
MKRVIALGLLLLALGGGAIEAAVKPPQDVIQDTSTRMIDALRQNRAKLDRDPGQIYGLVDQIVLPNFDFELMSRWVLGRAWQQASPDQRRRFTEEFRTLLVRTYAKALLEYSGEDIRLLPQPTVGDGSEVTVKTEVQLKAGRPIQINYSMHLNNDGWKVYDVKVDGVSLVTNYRSTFASQIRANGMDSVIADLQQRNTAQGPR